MLEFIAVFGLPIWVISGLYLRNKTQKEKEQRERAMQLARDEARFQSRNYKRTLNDLEEDDAR